MIIDDDEVISVMIDGANQLCQNSLQKWYGNHYQLDEQTRQDNIKRWKEIQNRVSILGRLLKDAIKSD